MMRFVWVIFTLLFLSGCINDGVDPTGHPVPDGPKVMISAPTQNESVVPPISINGTAEVKHGEVILVQIRMGGSKWQNAQGQEDWTYEIGDLPVGNHTIEARALADGDRWGDITSLIFTVGTPTTSTFGDRGLDLEGVLANATWYSNETMDWALNVSVAGHGRTIHDNMPFNGTAKVTVGRALPPSPCGDDLIEPVTEFKLNMNHDNFSQEGVVAIILPGPFDQHLRHDVLAKVTVSLTGRTYEATDSAPANGGGGFYDEGAFATDFSPTYEWDSVEQRLDVGVGAYNGGSSNPCRFSGLWEYELYEKVGDHYEWATDGLDYIFHNQQGHNNEPHSVGPSGGWFYDENRWHRLNGRLTVFATDDVYEFEHEFYSSTD